MPSYIAESYLSRTRRGELSSQATRAREAANALSAKGQTLAYLRSAFVPEDEVCLHWFIAPSPAAVTEVARRAKLEFDRVIKEVEQPPTPNRSKPHLRHAPHTQPRNRDLTRNNHRGGTN